MKKSDKEWRARPGEQRELKEMCFVGLSIAKVVDSGGTSGSLAAGGAWCWHPGNIPYSV